MPCIFLQLQRNFVKFAGEKKLIIYRHFLSDFQNFNYDETNLYDKVMLILMTDYVIIYFHDNDITDFLDNN